MEDTPKPTKPAKLDSADPKNLMRDSYILEGRATLADRAKWQKEWNRYAKLGMRQVWKIEDTREFKRENKKK